eukprot:CAMPEP_0171063794 /NCGR_PEP_ID=MMETSP0766_2-20121228/5898_1 /TAXON_ID=439317 /ORGANISM="Gambierdiscus australes, Strain CAWD 149" /LENGTH=79 /DNA_ID=CAMNT_0011519759 /DNA_START=571 /DNA_END=807 /DNA_ORIENTATION=+
MVRIAHDAQHIEGCKHIQCLPVLVHARCGHCSCGSANAVRADLVLHEAKGHRAATAVFAVVPYGPHHTEDLAQLVYDHA